MSERRREPLKSPGPPAQIDLPKVALVGTWVFALAGLVLVIVRLAGGPAPWEWVGVCTVGVVIGLVWMSYPVPRSSRQRPREPATTRQDGATDRPVEAVPGDLTTAAKATSDPTDAPSGDRPIRP